ncbi:MAG: FadR/GntR family transcriptional regulator [Micrococcus sp.]|nr:FadR/GntR family transcriptional regulator [Micrococcus sp.]
MRQIPTRRPAAASTTEAIQDYIRRHRLAPGSLMPTEAELCDEIGVSRSSIREAMRVLATLDIVDVRHGHGTFVGELSLTPLVSGLVFRGSLAGGTISTLRDVVQLRTALDLQVGPELIEYYRGTTNPDLRALVDQMRERNARGEHFREPDLRFHELLTAPLENEIVRQLITAFWSVHTDLVPLIASTPSADMDATVQAHDDIVSALEAGDGPGYDAAIRAHYAPLSALITNLAQDQPR